MCVEQKYSAASLCSITTEVLKVLNATEELIGEAGGDSVTPSECMSASESFLSNLETRKLDQKLTKMEENVRPSAYIHLDVGGHYLAMLERTKCSAFSTLNLILTLTSTITLDKKRSK